ncbi:dTDP-4-dehydrorhamnose 3,5-epimerase [Luminiphilus sp.]|nr:dTDP-4-dehydrorhamnose 3,5-epimerase [Luminiphilus sp.]
MIRMEVMPMAFDAITTPGSIIKDIAVISVDSYIEARGEIWTSYTPAVFDGLMPISFCHDKFSVSKKNVLRGIHGDHKSWKLISCPFGEITAVVVDLREHSASYKMHEMFRLGADVRQQILIPPGVGNSFYVHSEFALYHYKLAYHGEYADADDQFTVAWNDPELNIMWPCEDPILSERDARL